MALTELKQLNPELIRNYLEHHNWIMYKEYSDNSGSVWTKDEHHVRLLYKINEYEDYYDELNLLIRDIAQYENRPREKIIAEILNPTRDIIKIHIPEPLGKDGYIPFERAIEKLESIKNLWLSSASSTESLLLDKTPNLIYSPHKSDMINSNVKKLLLGQTEVGSYVFTIEMDVTPTDIAQKEIDGIKTPDSFARAVNLTMCRAITAINDSYEENLHHPENRTQDIIKQNQRIGVNVNICEAIGEISIIDEEVYADINIDIEWASNYPVPADIPIKLEIGAKQTEICVATAKDYRKKYPAEFNQTFAGRVMKLQQPEKSDEKGIVTIKTTIHSKKNSSLTIELPWGNENSDYDKAIKAHQTHCMLQCVGDLIKNGDRGYKLIDPHNVEVLSGEDDTKQTNKKLSDF